MCLVASIGTRRGALESKLKIPPAIALSGFGMEQDIESYREAGVDAELTKPVSFQKLEMTINQFFGPRII